MGVYKLPTILTDKEFMTGLIELPEFDFSDPLQELQNNRIVQEPLWATYRNKLKHLKIIYYRIRQDLVEHNILENKFYDIMKSVKGQSGSFSREQNEIMSQHSYAMLILHLDIEDYFIHSRILLDLLARIIHGFLQRPRYIESKSFYALKKSILKNYESMKKNFEEYADYIKNNTHWFEINLKEPRDHLIVHNTGKMPVYRLSKKTGFTIERITFPPNTESKKKLANDVISIKKKYEPSNPELSDIPDNIFEILKANFQKLSLTKKEIEIIEKAKIEFGGELPNIEKLNKEIFEFLKFTASYFSKINKN